MLQVAIFQNHRLFKTYFTAHSIKLNTHNSVDANMALVQYVKHALLLY